HYFTWRHQRPETSSSKASGSASRRARRLQEKLRQGVLEQVPKSDEIEDLEPHSSYCTQQAKSARRRRVRRQSRPVMPERDGRTLPCAWPKAAPREDQCESWKAAAPKEVPGYPTCSPFRRPRISR